MLLVYLEMFFSYLTFVERQRNRKKIVRQRWSFRTHPMISYSPRTNGSSKVFRSQNELPPEVHFGELFRTARKKLKINLVLAWFCLKLHHISSFFNFVWSISGPLNAEHKFRVWVTVLGHKSPPFLLSFLILKNVLAVLAKASNYQLRPNSEEAFEDIM